MSEHAFYTYHLFCAALELFARIPAELTPEEIALARSLANKTFLIETRILQSENAQQISVVDKTVAEARREIMMRYDSEKDFLNELLQGGFTEEVFDKALERKLLVEAILETVAEHASPVSEDEAAAYYARNIEKFQIPERRSIHQILITVNPDFPENTPEAAWERIMAIHARLSDNPASFAAEAQRHSECPSALQGGHLGTVDRGFLIPKIDQVAFALSAHAISDIVETEIGFHILKCEAIMAARSVPFHEARPQIESTLDEAKRTQARTHWIRQICRPQLEGQGGSKSLAPQSEIIIERGQPCTV